MKTQKYKHVSSNPGRIRRCERGEYAPPDHSSGEHATRTQPVCQPTAGGLEESITSKKRAEYPPQLNMAQTIDGRNTTPSYGNVHPLHKADDTKDAEPKH